MYFDGAYAPFGDQYAGAGTSDRVFTGQTQDIVPARIEFPFRQYSSSQGRWLVPDPAGLEAVDIENPQTWNRYAYVANNPLRNIDVNGLILTCGDPGQDVDDPFCYGSDGGAGGGGGDDDDDDDGSGGSGGPGGPSNGAGTGASSGSSGTNTTNNSQSVPCQGVLCFFAGSYSGVWNVGMNSLGMSTFTTTQSQGFWQSTGLAGYLPQNQNPQGQAAAAMSQYLQGPSYTLTETWSTGGSGAVPVYQVKIIGPGLLGQPFSPGTSLQNAFAQSCPKVPTINTSTTCDNLPEPEKSKCLKIKAPKINCQGLPSL